MKEKGKIEITPLHWSSEWRSSDATSATSPLHLLRSLHFSSDDSLGHGAASTTSAKVQLGYMLRRRCSYCFHLLLRSFSGTNKLDLLLSVFTSPSLSNGCVFFLLWLDHLLLKSALKDWFCFTPCPISDKVYQQSYIKLPLICA